MNPSHPLTARRIAAIKAALAGGVLNVHQIAVRIALCVPRTEDYLEMMVANEEIHIQRWAAPAETGKQQRIQHYAPGKGINAPKPIAQTSAEQIAKARAKVRKDADQHGLALAHVRMQRHIRRQLKTPNTWLSALGVPA